MDRQWPMRRSGRSGYRRRKVGIYKQAIDKTKVQTLVTEDGYFGGPRLSPDGAWLLYCVAPKQGGLSMPARIVRIPINGGAPNLVFEARNVAGPGIRCTRGPAGFCAVDERSPDKKRLTITRFDPFKGRGLILKTIETDPAAGYDWDLAPDGSKLALYKIGEPEARIRLISLRDGRDRDLPVKGWGSLQGIEWSPDGKALYCGSASSNPWTLLRIDMQGQAQVLWSQKGQFPAWAIPSPDGRHLAIRSQLFNNNLWMLEGF